MPDRCAGLRAACSSYFLEDGLQAAVEDEHGYFLTGSAGLSRADLIRRRQRSTRFAAGSITIVGAIAVAMADE